MPVVAETSVRCGQAGRAGSDARSDLHVSFEERNGGGIEIESEAGVGTRVRLVFPRYPEAFEPRE